MRRFRKIMIITFSIIAALVLAVYVFMQLPMFGRLPSGERAERIKASPNFKDGKFTNLHETPDIIEGVSYYTVMKEFFFNKSPRSTPADTIPSRKTSLLALPPSQNVLIWFGHSSYYMQLDGKKFLIDPVFSGAASPISFTTPSFPGTDIYTVDELPDVDYLLITHDHWDHLDHDTILKLKGKVKKIITGLGTGDHLEYWGYDKSLIIEKDWNETVPLSSGFSVTVTPARHFSGRGLARNRALWVSFVVQGPVHKVYVGGDSGYDDHYKAIGEKYGPFDLALLECGQYNEYWKYIHMMPEETAQAAVDLRAKRLMPVHWSKFALALHAWDEPILKVTEAAKKLNLDVVHPFIGEKVQIDSATEYSTWWEGVEK
jgi:L-ascorbate metabolism protein UlaG (beta-lactamase superfamily)